MDKGRAALLALVLQNTLLVLTMRYSRTRPGPMYLASSAVIVDEALKASVCVMALAWQYTELRRGGISPDMGGFWSFFRKEVCERPAETAKMAVVAALYTVQKNALYVAVSNLDAAVFQLTYQFKILTTALFTCSLLGRSFTRQQILALCVLTLGVGLVQVDTATGGSGEMTGSHHQQTHMLGVCAVLLACCTSGFAGVYFERVLKKGKQVSLFAKNLQLSAFAFCVAVVVGILRDFPKIQEDGFFQGFSPLVCCVVLLEACGGLVVAVRCTLYMSARSIARASDSRLITAHKVVIKFADNILKTLATSLSIVTSTMLSFWLLDLHVSGVFVIGALLVLLAIYLYSVPCSDRYLYGPLSTSGDAVPGSAGSSALSAAISSVQARVRVRRRLRACCLGSAAFILVGTAARVVQVARQVEASSQR